MSAARPARFFRVLYPAMPRTSVPLHCYPEVFATKPADMLIHAAEPLFAGGQLDDCPTPATIRAFLQAVPDQPLLEGLQGTTPTSGTPPKPRDEPPLPHLKRD